MPGVTRLVMVPANGQIDVVARRAADRIAQGRSVLIVAFDRPAAILQRRFAELGVDLARLFIVDATPAGPERGAHDPEHLARVPSPSLLELLTMRVRQVTAAKATGKPHFIIHNLDAMARYNPPEAIQELFLYVRGSRAFPDADIDFICNAERTCDPRVLSFLEGEAGETLHLS